MQEPAILVVDDVADIVAEMVTMLELVGVPALGAASLPEALRGLHDRPSIRAIICDLHLQREDGRTLLALLRDEPALANRSLGVLFMTGDSDVESAPAHTPPITILRKPIDPDLVIERVRHCLGMAAGGTNVQER